MRPCELSREPVQEAVHLQSVPQALATQCDAQLQGECSMAS